MLPLITRWYELVLFSTEVRQFPYSTIRHLTDEQRDDLVTQLELESKTIRIKFASLVSKTALVIDKTSDDLKYFFAGCGMKELANNIDSQDSISAIMGQVTEVKGWSFFDYELLEHFIETFCKDEEIIEDLKRYKLYFQGFCERRLYEVPVNIFDMNLPHVHSEAKVVMKIDEEFFDEGTGIRNLLTSEKPSAVSLSKIKKIQHKLSKVLSIEHLTFLDAQEGCIELTFRHFEENNPILSLSTLKGINLALIGVNKITCGSESYNLQPYVSPPPSYNGKHHRSLISLPVNSHPWGQESTDPLPE